MAGDATTAGNGSAADRGAVGPGPVLTVTEVAQALRVSSMTVYRLVQAGDLPALRVGKNIRIRVADLDTYLTSGTVVPDEANG